MTTKLYEPAPHAHWTLGSITVLGFFLAVVALFLGIAAMVLGPKDTGLESVIPELTPKAGLPSVPETEVNVSYAPAVPPPSGRQTQAVVEVRFEIVETVAAIGPDGAEYTTWGYRLAGDDTVHIGTPGPMIRARVGDLLRFVITSPASNTNPHNVDFHAVTGQGGGAADTTVAPGETGTIEVRLLYPGIFMYHCAFGDVPLHISHGMFGGILVDPEQPLPEVDHEWYVVQSEYYTKGGADGSLETDRAAITAEEPTHVVFNGAIGALTGDNALKMRVGETARFYFVNAGLNMISSFHPIGSHWDVVYQEGALLSPPIRGSQTTLVPAGGGVVVEMIGQVPSTVILVDHALARTFDKGALGMVIVEGDPNPEIFGALGATEAEPDNGGSVGTDHTVAILAGSSTVQDMDHPDEFSAGEDPADYSKNVLTVMVGDTVTWVQNDPGQIHTATATDGSFDSGFLEEGKSFSYTFEEVGEFEYYCLPHPWMRAKIVVVESMH